MYNCRIPKWGIPNSFGTNLTFDEEDKVLHNIVKALRLLSDNGKRMKNVAGVYAEAIDLEVMRRGGMYGNMKTVKKEKLPTCNVCMSEGTLRLFPI